MSVFVAAIVGFAVGCFLHAMPVTSSFVYTDVLALGVASITATLLTTIWVFIDPELQPLKSPSDTSGKDAQPLFSQDKIGTDPCHTRLGGRITLSTFVGPSVRSSDGSPVADMITQFLTMVSRREPDPMLFSSDIPWQRQVLETALEMWRADSVTIIQSSRQVFAQVGCEKSWSLSEYKYGKLLIVAGFLDDSEIDMYQTYLHDNLALL
jgi:hypothetical protein